MKKTILFCVFYIFTMSILFAQTDTVHIIQYTATQQGSKVNLSWQTTIERQINFFSVERGVDSSHYNTIAHIKARNTSTTSSYQFSDLNSLSSGCYFYRLEVVYYGGKIDSSNVLKLCYKALSIDEVATPHSFFSIYYNSSSNCISIIPPSLNYPYHVTIYNLMGQVVHTSADLQSGGYINCNNFKKGIYFYLIHLEENNYKTSGKIIID